VNYFQICVFVGFSLVATCKLTKTICNRCNFYNAPCLSTPVGLTENECYRDLDGCTNVVGEWRTDKSECIYDDCFHTNINYAVDRVAMLMTCSSGINFQLFKNFSLLHIIVMYHPFCIT